jgi:hypothetical protein
MTKSVAILGCGPAGLMAAHAAHICGWDFRVYSKKMQSKLYGAQYLHAPIPGVTNEAKTVRYTLRGTPEQYRRKVYGDSWDGTTSPEDFMEEHNAWDLRWAYSDLWYRYAPEIVDCTFYDISYEELRKHLWWGRDLVVSTIPRTVWDSNNANFQRTYIWALGDTELPRVDKPYRPEPFTVACDGTPGTPWYRVSNIYGHCTMEWPYNGVKSYIPVEGASLVTKPLRYLGNAAPDFLHLGRYGAWQKGVLTSDVFHEAMKAFRNDTIG